MRGHHFYKPYFKIVLSKMNAKLNTQLLYDAIT